MLIRVMGKTRLFFVRTNTAIPTYHSNILYFYGKG